jgi:hypothetical protein
MRGPETRQLGGPYGPYFQAKDHILPSDPEEQHIKCTVSLIQRLDTVLNTYGLTIMVPVVQNHTFPFCLHTLDCLLFTTAEKIFTVCSSG